MSGISATDVKALRDQTGAGMMDCKKALTDAEGDVERAIDLLRERGLSKAGKRAGRDTGEGAIAFSIQGGDGVLIELGCETDFVSRNDQFQTLVQEIADTIRGAGEVADVEAALALQMGDETVDAHVKSAVGRIGENIQLKRVASVHVEGAVGGYIHGGGKLGVLVGLVTAAPEAAEAVAKDVAMHVAASDPTPLAVDRDGVDGSVVEKEREILRNQALASGKPEKIVDNIVSGRINKFYAENCLVEQPFVKDPDKTVGEIVGEAGDVKVSEFIRFKLGEGAG
ncbi:MAG: elongation factor Ts [Deltaproteobacteria bacterium]|nr:elongation factor Ts [Deltaproteobacteria bacterium]